MKTLIATAGGLALLASGALANPNTDGDEKTARVTLNAVVGEYIAITNYQGSTMTDLNVLTDSSDGANNNVNLATGEEKATFTVAANVDYDIELDWATWDDEGPGQPSSWPSATTYSQAYYVNSAEGCAIGGTIHFDEAPAVSGAAATPPSGAAPWTVGSYTPTFGRTFGIGTQASPNLNDCPGDIAAPGTYSLDVDITLSAS